MEMGMHDQEMPFDNSVPKEPLMCRVWGHKLNGEASHYYCLDYCDRCHCEVTGRTGLREWLKVRLWLAQQWLAWQAKRFRYWWKCSDCGHHFGKHDEAADHLPF
jgi:hypothetical protein